MRGHLTEKTDVFAFGVLALEVVAGRANADSNLEPDQVYLLDWVFTISLSKVNPFIDQMDYVQRCQKSLCWLRVQKHVEISKCFYLLQFLNPTQAVPTGITKLVVFCIVEYSYFSLTSTCSVLMSLTNRPRVKAKIIFKYRTVY
jgi:hypothetical protein